MVFKKVELPFQSCTSEYDEAKVIIFSAPMDWTTSYRPGTRFAGNAIRVDSFGLEWYSPYMDMDLKEHKTCDIGDLNLPIGDIVGSLENIEKVTQKIIEDNKRPIMIGGEHLVSLGVVRALVKKYPNLRIIHLDAHTDLRDEFFTMKLSHATVMRRIYDIVGKNKIYQFGIRSGERSEFIWAKENTHLQKFNLDGLDEIIKQIKDYPVYITIDLDVLDPSIFPGTGTPEAGGISYQDLLWAFKQFRKLNQIVGFDIVELSPHYDHSGISTALASKTLRELVLLLHENIEDK